MADMVILPDSLRALSAALRIHADRIKVEPYCYDDRTGWKTYLVTVDGQAVGFTDGPLVDK